MSTHPPGEDPDAYYSRLRREAEAFIGGAGRSGGADLYREIERAVARHLVGRDRLPATDGQRQRLSKPAGRGDDRFSPAAAWDLLHDFIVAYLFEPSDPKIYVALQRGRDLNGFRHWLRELLRRYIGERMRDDEAVRMRDSLLKGLGAQFAQSGLVRCGSRPNTYWSERERTAQEASAIYAELDVENSFDLVVRDIADQTVTLPEGASRRLTSGWGPGERRRMAAILAARLSAELPGLGATTFIPERLLKARLTLLIEANFPELFTDPLYVPLSEADHGAFGEERETTGVRHIELTDSIGAADAAIETTETLTFRMPPIRPGSTSGADMKRAMRLLFDGAFSTREAETAWSAEPTERRGDRPITLESLVECMPGGARAESTVARNERLAALCAAFSEPSPSSGPWSHVTINALRTRCWGLWAESCEGLSPVAHGLAFHWFVDMLFLDVGRDTPFSSIDDAAMALADAEVAYAAAVAADRTLRRRAAKPPLTELLTALRLSDLGRSPGVSARRMGIPRAEAVRLSLAGRAAIDKAWTDFRLLPIQQAMAEDRLMELLQGPDLDTAAAGDR